MATEVDTEVVVVGAGATGLAAAWRLAEAGHDVILIEQFALGHDRGSSHGATRIFRFAYPDPLYVRMAQMALPMWRELGADVLRITGGIDLGPEDGLTQIQQALASCGAAADHLDAAERAARWPWLSAGERPALYSPDTGVISASLALETMASRARAAGARIIDQTRAEQIVPNDSSVTIRTQTETITAARAVIAAGGWTGPLLAPLGLRPALRVTREQVFYFDAGFDIIPFIDRAERFRYGVPRAADRRHPGAPGIKVAEHEAGVTTTAAARTFAIDEAGRARLLDYVSSTLPGADADPVAAETCLYTLTANEDFLIDVHGPLVIASPCSGHGFKFAPLIGDILARLSTGRVLPLSLERFALTNFV